MKNAYQGRFLRRVAGAKAVPPVAASAAALLAVTLLGEAPALAGPEPRWDPPGPPEVTDVAVTEVAPPGRPVWTVPEAAMVAGVPEVTWPPAATERVALPARAAAQAGMPRPDGAPAPGTPGRAAAGDLPVRVGAAPLTADQAEDVVGGVARAQAVAPAAVQVRAAGPDEAAAAGVRGLLVAVARADGSRLPARVAVEVDYSGFRHAYGGDWASRLRIAVLPTCEPAAGPAGAAARSCGAPVPLPTANDLAAGVLAATVPLPSDGAATTLAVSAGPAGDNGEYTATSLSPPATWQISQQTGDFAWTYPLRVVPGVGGPEPSLALSYASGSLDGRTAATNTQPSWVGDGFELWPGFIERRYRTCAEDTDPVGGQQPNNRNRKTADLCWFSDNATLSLNGRATELVPDGGNRYRGVDDDGSRIERLTGPSLGNGDNDGEYWRVTTVDGTQYFFGRHRRPAYPADTAATNSTQTVPVYGNHPGEPCYQAGDFSGSRCQQAWRWNLDYVIDPLGSSMTHFYSREDGWYGRELDPAKRTSYHRGIRLNRIEYGTRTGQEHTTGPLARVVFDTADRCTPGATCTQSNPSAWPDTPWDQHCAASPCTDQLAPTFWTSKKLSRIRTQVRRGSSWSTVESWTLQHEWLDAGSWAGEGIPMWLRSITRTGHVTAAGGSTVSDPPTVFDPGGAPLDNRVDGPDDNRSALARWRIRTITTESGAQLGIGYSARQCTRASLPTPHTNTRRCFPQWYGPYDEEPTLDWFHKYVVTRMDVYDNTGGSGHQQTSYDYLDSPAWHYDDTLLVPEKRRTWGQWRGFSRVRVRQGLAQETQSATEFRYLRGMHGDRAGPSGGTRTVQVTDSQGTSITDHEAHAGFLREETVHNGPGGAWVSGRIDDPWRHGPTATAGPLNAWLTGTGKTRTRTALAGGGTRWTGTATSFDPTYGLPTQVDQLGDEATSADDRCLRYQYARNPALGMVDRVSRVETVGVRCAATPQRPADVVSDERTFYDDPDHHGAAPTRGLPVRTQEIGSWNGTSPVWVTTGRTGYDAHGRPVEQHDPLGRRTTTTYTPATGGPVTRTVETNPLGHTVTSVLEPAWGLPTRVTDPNGRVTDLTYDGLGRLTAVWLPGRPKGSVGPNLELAYLVRNDRPTAVTTRELLPDAAGNAYRTSITLFDAQLRQRQTQAQAPGGGRVIEDTVYDSRGLVDWESHPYFSSGSPSTNMVTTAGQPQIPGITDYLHDGAERVTAEIFKAQGQERWRTSYAYGGDRTHQTPPTGGTALTAVTDALGRVTALRQFHGPTPAGGYDETRYTYTNRDELATMVDAAGNTWRFGYDQRGRQVSTIDPATGTTVTTYDDADQVTTVTDARGVTLGYTYDALGRRTSVRNGSPTGATLAAWVYDTLPNGIGSLTRSVRHESGSQYRHEVVGYDGVGRPTGTRVVIPSAETGLAGTYQTTVQYRPDGSLNARNLPALGGLASERLVFSYNDVGAPTELVSSRGIYADQVTYNKLGDLTGWRSGDQGSRVQVSRIIDEATRRLVNLRAERERPQAPTILDLHYAYDPAGNLTRIADTQGTAAPVDTQCYRYDQLRRLTAAWTPQAGSSCQANPTVGTLGGPAPYWHSWTHDVTGNRLTQTVHAAAGNTVTSYRHPDPGQPQPHAVTSATTSGPGGSSVNSYGYDPAGNLTSRTVAGASQSLTWHPEGQLRSVTRGSDVTSYVYDADGNRLVRRDATSRTLYLPDGQELRHTAATGARTGTRYYTHSGSTLAVRTEAGVSWLVNDHHGTAEAAVTASDLSVARRRTLPFGETRGPAPSNWSDDKGFVGGTQDPTGLTNLAAREYDPALGRFISVDPLVDHFDPQRLHGYAYGNNAPSTFSDPDGRFWHEAGGASESGRVRSRVPGSLRGDDPFYSYMFDVVASDYLVTCSVGGCVAAESTKPLYMSVEDALTELHRCFNCSFPIGNAPSHFPSERELIPLKACLLFCMDAPVRSYTMPDGFYLVAQDGHFDAAGSVISFKFSQARDSRLQLTVTAWVDSSTVPRLLNKNLARTNWASFARRLGNNMYDNSEEGATRPWLDTGKRVGSKSKAPGTRQRAKTTSSGGGRDPVHATGQSCINFVCVE